MENIKVTKTMRYEDIIALLRGEDVKAGTDIETACSFLENEVALLKKKNSTVSKAKKEQAKIDEADMERIVSFLADGNEYTCTAIQHGVAYFMENEYSCSKISSLLTKLVNGGRVSKKKGKNNASLFTIA